MLILLLLLAFLGFSLGSGSSPVSPTAAPVERVPSVVGVASPSAERLVRSAGHVPVERWCTVRSSSGYAVARQSPAAGSPLRAGAGVRLFLVPALGQGVRHPACNSFAGSRP